VYCTVCSVEECAVEVIIVGKVAEKRGRQGRHRQEGRTGESGEAWSKRGSSRETTSERASESLQGAVRKMAFRKLRFGRVGRG